MINGRNACKRKRSGIQPADARTSAPSTRHKRQHREHERRYHQHDTNVSTVNMLHIWQEIRLVDVHHWCGQLHAHKLLHLEAYGAHTWQQVHRRNPPFYNTKSYWPTKLWIDAVQPRDQLWRGAAYPPPALPDGL